MRPITWLAIGLITALAVVDLNLAAWLFGLTMSELFAAVVSTAAGLSKVAMTAIASALANAACPAR